MKTFLIVLATAAVLHLIFACVGAPRAVVKTARKVGRAMWKVGLLAILPFLGAALLMGAFRCAPGSSYSVRLSSDAGAIELGYKRERAASVCGPEDGSGTVDAGPDAAPVIEWAPRNGRILR